MFDAVGLPGRGFTITMGDLAEERGGQRGDGRKERQTFGIWGGANPGSKNDAIHLGEFTTSVLPSPPITLGGGAFGSLKEGWTMDVTTVQ